MRADFNRQSMHQLAARQWWRLLSLPAAPRRDTSRVVPFRRRGQIK